MPMSGDMSTQIPEAIRINGVMYALIPMDTMNEGVTLKHEEEPPKPPIEEPVVAEQPTNEETKETLPTSQFRKRVLRKVKTIDEGDKRTYVYEKVVREVDANGRIIEKRIPVVRVYHPKSKIKS